MLFAAVSLASLVVAAGPHQHYPQWSSAYAWNTTTLPPLSVNLAQAATIAEVLVLSERNIASVMANIQQSIFVRAAGVGSVLTKDWEVKLDSLMDQMVRALSSPHPPTHYNTHTKRRKKKRKVGDRHHTTL